MRIPRSPAARALLAGLAACLATRAAAQPDSLGVQLQKLQTPTSPAFIVLGVSPTVVERPTTPRAFALSVASSSLQSDDLVPKNYAAEFAPYWMGLQRRLQFQDYYRPNLFQALQQTFSVSFATNTIVQSDDSLPAVGLGLRVAPFVGQPSRRLDSLNRGLTRVDSLLLVVRMQLRRASTAADSARLQGQSDAVGDCARALSTQLRAALRDDDERVGFRLQLAAGLAAYYPGNLFTSGKIGRTGAWGT